MTNEPRETPEDVLKRLSAGADPRRVRALQRIHDVCVQQRSHGSHDFSLTTVGRLLRDKGGPSTKSLGNASSLTYRTLIAAHRTADEERSPKRRGDEADGLLDGVRDPLQRDRIRDLRNEVRSLRGRVKALQHFASTSASLTIVSTPRGTAAATSALTPPELRPYENDALVSVLDPRRLKRLRLVEKPNGRVETENGEEYFPVGFASALRKVMASLGLIANPTPIGGSPVSGSREPKR